MTVISKQFSRPGNVALLIDGENISPSLADTIFAEAEKQGSLMVRRVYGDVKRLSGWGAVSGMRLVHSGSGKNAADLLMAIEAVEMAHRGAVDSYVLASSDGDFAHLAAHLRERGFTVVGVGENKAPERFRQSCCRFVQVDRSSEFDRNIHQMIREEPGADGLLITLLNARMRTKHGIKISSYLEKTWRRYLLDRPDFYAVDPKGAEARVRLIANN